MPIIPHAWVPIIPHAWMPMIPHAWVVKVPHARSMNLCIAVDNARNGDNYISCKTVEEEK